MSLTCPTGLPAGLPIRPPPLPAPPIPAHLQEAALKAGVRGATGEEVGAAAAEDAAEGLAGAAIGLPWSSRVRPRGLPVVLFP